MAKNTRYLAACPAKAGARAADDCLERGGGAARAKEGTLEGLGGGLAGRHVRERRVAALVERHGQRLVDGPRLSDAAQLDVAQALDLAHLLRGVVDQAGICGAAGQRLGITAGSCHT